MPSANMMATGSYMSNLIKNQNRCQNLLVYTKNQIKNPPHNIVYEKIDLVWYERKPIRKFVENE